MILLEDLSVGRYFGLSHSGRLWSRVLCAPLSRLGETRTDLGRRVDNSFGLLTVCRPKKELFFFLHVSSQKHVT